MKIEISKRDTSIIKGFAILCIVLHNYFHWLWPSPGENEFDFQASRVISFFHSLGQQPGEWFNLLFSYLGHYGVQIFIFISGFGLTVSMINRPRSWESFMVVRLKKLYPLLLTAVLTWLLAFILMEKRWPDSFAMTEIGYKLLFIHTLLPNSGLSINGPWWFFGLIFQLYLVFPLLFGWFRKWGWRAFVYVSVFSYGLVFLFRYGLNELHGSLVMMNAPGHLPEFCLGILLALHKDRKIGWGWLLLAVALFCLGNVNEYCYPFTFLAVTVIALFAYQGLKNLPLRKQWISRPLAYFGGISMALFAVHGFFRVPVLTFAQTTQGVWGHLLSGLVFLLIVWAVAIAAKVFYDFLYRQLDKIHICETRVTFVIGRICGFAIGVFFVYVFGYYVAHNLHRNTQPMEVNVTQNGAANKDAEIIPIMNAEIDKSWRSLDIRCSFDITSKDTLAPLPYVVLDISGLLWNKFDIPNTYNTSNPQRFELTYRYLCPFVKCLKGKRINVYLRDPNKASAFRFENAEVTVLH